MTKKHIDLPLLLDELSWKNKDLLPSGVARYARTALMVSDELPAILRRWHRPPRTHGKGTRTRGAIRSLDEFSVEVVRHRANKEMRKVGELMRSPPSELSGKNLLAISWQDSISEVRAAAPMLWNLVRSAAYTPMQEKINITKDPDPVRPCHHQIMILY